MIESYASAFQQFQNFLIAEGYTQKPLWIFREDVLERSRRLWLRWPLPPTNVLRAEEEYERGRQLRFGIGLATYCIADSCPCCFVNVAENTEEASHMMMSGGLKLSILQNPPQAQLIRNKRLWRVLRLLTHRSELLSV